jgi:hypothetical protein
MAAAVASSGISIVTITNKGAATMGKRTPVELEEAIHTLYPV